MWRNVTRDEEQRIGSRRGGRGHLDRRSSWVPTNSWRRRSGSRGGLAQPFLGFCPCTEPAFSAAVLCDKKNGVFALQGQLVYTP